MNQATNRGPIYNSLCQSKKKGYGVHISDPKAGWDPKALPRPSHLQGEGLLANGVKILEGYYQCPCFIIFVGWVNYPIQMLTKRLDPQKKWDLCSVNENKEISVFTQGNLQVPPGSNTTFCWFAMCFILAPYHHKPTAFFPVFSYELLLSQDWEEQVEISNDNVLTSVVFKI